MMGIAGSPPHVGSDRSFRPGIDRNSAWRDIALQCLTDPRAPPVPPEQEDADAFPRRVVKLKGRRIAVTRLHPVDVRSYASLVQTIRPLHGLVTACGGEMAPWN